MEKLNTNNIFDEIIENEFEGQRYSAIKLATHGNKNALNFLKKLVRAKLFSLHDLLAMHRYSKGRTWSVELDCGYTLTNNN